MPLRHKLPDVLGADLRVVFCGTAAGERSAALGAYYAGAGNAFWPTLHKVGLTPRQLLPQEFKLLPSFGIGLTDIAKYRAGTDDTLAADAFNVSALRKKVKQFAPRALAFNGKKAAAIFRGCDTGDLLYGLQADGISETAIWVLPSTSSGARGFWDIRPWRDLAGSVPPFR